MEEFRVWVIGLMSVGAGYVTYIVYLLVRGLFSAKAEDEKMGGWAAGAYTYHEPVHLKTVTVTPEDNEIPIPIKVKDAPKGSFIRYKIEVEEAKDRTFVSLNFVKPNKLGNWGEPNGFRPPTGGLRMDRHRQVYLYTILLPSTVPVTIRVYMKGWEP